MKSRRIVNCKVRLWKVIGRRSPFIASILGARKIKLTPLPNKSHLLSPLVSATILISSSALFGHPTALQAQGLPGSSSLISADPDVMDPGKPVTISWKVTGTKLTIRGGRFLTGMNVTGKAFVTDSPKKTTEYVLEAVQPDLTADGDGSKPTPNVTRLYKVTVYVDKFVPEPMTSFTDPHGWTIKYLSSWKRDVSTPDNGQESIVFFQKEFDSVERMALAIVPANGMRPHELLQKALGDAPARYANLYVSSSEPLAISGLPAETASFSGIDLTHPGTRTTSTLYAVVSGPRAYVVSVRSSAARFPYRRRSLLAMLRSFTITHPVMPTLLPPSPAPLPKPQVEPAASSAP